jgi:hypothetical protein
VLVSFFHLYGNFQKNVKSSLTHTKPTHKNEQNRNETKYWKNVLCKVNFFPPKFCFQKYKRKIWREKITL